MNLKVKLPVSPLNPLLPQQETAAGAADRRKLLKARQAEYALSSNNPLRIPMLGLPIPERESFSSRYNAERGAASEPVTANETAINTGTSTPFGPLDGLAEYENLYPVLPAPLVMADWLTDPRFGEQRLSGVNPGMIRRVSSDADLNPMDVPALKAALGTPALEYPLYIVDYSKRLEKVSGGRTSIPNVGDFDKFCPKPTALFRWVGEPENDGLTFATRGLFLPVAIQVDVVGGVRVFTPKSPSLLWTIAKICFSIADANFHEMSTHLGRSHFALESLGVVTPRQLAPQHPVFILLQPHLKFLVWNNQQGVERLVQVGGPVDLLLAGTREQSLDVAIDAAKGWSIEEDFEADLGARGVTSTKELPHYPFRDDGLLLWRAIDDYVKGYLDLYYQDDGMVEKDTEIQAWAAELASDLIDGGRIKGFPKVIGARKDLAAIVTKIIFSLSAGHSAINYPQYPYLGFSPNAPLAGYADYRAFLAKPPESRAAQLDWLTKFLPPHFAAAGQIAITASLSVYHYDMLGDYAEELADPRARYELYKFVQTLHTIERIIEDRNLRRLVPYRFLLPSEILNGASI